MSGRILVLGAAGRLGFAAAEAFRDAGWSVKGLVRPGRASCVPRGVEPVEAVTRDEAVAGGARLRRGAQRAQSRTSRNGKRTRCRSPMARSPRPRTTARRCCFPAASGTTAAACRRVLDESTPMQPTTRKGAMRVEIEQRIKEACDRGMRAIVLRAGDFFGGGRGSWFDLVICKEHRAPAPDLSRPARRRCMPGPICRIYARTPGAARPHGARNSRRSRRSAFPATRSPARS